jgi:hypothetical protein
MHHDKLRQGQAAPLLLSLLLLFPFDQSVEQQTKRFRILTELIEAGNQVYPTYWLLVLLARPNISHTP